MVNIQAAATGAPTRQPAPTRVLVSQGEHAATSHAGSCLGIRAAVSGPIKDFLSKKKKKNAVWKSVWKG